MFKKLILTALSVLLISGNAWASSTVTASARQYTAANSEYHSITNAAQTGLNPGDANFYMAAWVRLDTTGVQRQFLSTWGAAGTRRYALYADNTNTPRIVVSADGTNGVEAAWGSAMSGTTWYFLEAYHDATNNVIGFCLNRGTDVTTSHSTGVFTGGTNPFTISSGSGSSDFMNGRIGPALFTSGIPTAAERNSLYNSGNGVLYKDRPTLSSATYTSWWDGAETSGNRIDALGVNNLTDNNTVTSVAGKVTYTAEDASQFTAANSEYLSVNDNTSLSLGSGVEATFAGWVYFDSLSSQMHIINKWNGASYEYFLDIGVGGDYKFRFGGYNPSGTYAEIKSNTFGAPVVNTWYYVECGWTGGNLFIAVNRGTRDTAALSNGLRDQTAPFVFGRNSDGGSAYLNGRLTMWNFWKTTIPSTGTLDGIYSRGFGSDYSELSGAELTGLESSWELTEASGTRNDSHGTNHLTDNNSVTGNPGVVYDAAAASSRRIFIISERARLFGESVYA